MSTDIVIVFIFFAGPIRGYSPGGRVNNFYSHGRRGNSHFEYVNLPLIVWMKNKPTLIKVTSSFKEEPKDSKKVKNVHSW